MKPLSPTMEEAIKRIDSYFKVLPNRPLQLRGAYVCASISTIHALARRGCCKITAPYYQDIITYENWHPDILHRLANS